MQNIQHPLESIMQKEMSRKEFLATIGFGLASIAGFSTILQLLGKEQKSPFKDLTPNRKSGYSANAYGK